jgi:hypothetical protein
MPGVVTNITFQSGYIVITFDGNTPAQYPIADVLRAADIPALTYSQVSSISALANLIVILIRTLMDAGYLPDTFIEGTEYSLDDIVEAIGNMGGDFGDPDLTGSES